MRGTLVLRRARRDAVLLAVIAVLVGCAVALATVLPRLVTEAVDAGARAAVSRAGPDGDLVVRTIVGHSVGGSAPAGTFAQLDELANGLPTRLPAVFRGILGAPTITVSSADAGGVVRSDAEIPNRVAVEFAAVGDRQLQGLQLVAGRLPRDGGPGVEVVVSRQAAAAASLAVGSEIALTKRSGDVLVATVVGIVATNDESARDWRDLRRMWQPTGPSNAVAGSGASIVAVTTQASMDAVQSLFFDTFTAIVRLPIVASAFTAQRVSEVIAGAKGLGLHSDELAGDFPAQVSILSDFEEALGDFPARSRAAIAQSSLLIAGVLGVAAVVLAQLGRLLALRRSGDLALERARGVALWTVAVGALAESIPVAALGAAAGLVAAGMPPPTLASLIVVLVAIAAPPTQAVLIARGAWWSRRIAANGVDRRAAERTRRARRLSVEALVVVLAAAAVVAIRGRGLLQGASDGIDPLLAAAPVLLAAAVAIVLLRVYPIVVRGVAALARRSTGALGVLGAAQAQRALPPCPCSPSRWRPPWSSAVA